MEMLLGVIEEIQRDCGVGTDSVQDLMEKGGSEIGEEFDVMKERRPDFGLPL